MENANKDEDKKKRSVWGWIAINWERVVFSAVGLFLIGFSVYFIFKGEITDAAIVFGLGFLSFIFANLARFKRFKGLGFEGELWEDKQKEAADLIERLKSVVSIYTHEVVMARVADGRWQDEIDWEGHWKLFDDLTSRHAELGQKIDFTLLKKKIDDYFLLDLSNQQRWAVQLSLNTAKEAAVAKVGEATNMHDEAELAVYNTKTVRINALPVEVTRLGKRLSQINVAQTVLDIWTHSSDVLRNEFQVEAIIEQKHLDRLKALSDLHKTRPVQITQVLFEWMRERP